jgi:predicted patatin/cPLA2 family phospholipase
MSPSDKPLPFRLPPNYQGPKRSLVLAGGGMRLAYQAGVLKALEEKNLCFHHADGTSGGIFNLALLLSGLTTDQICHNWRTVRIKDFVSYLPFQKYLNPFKLAAFGDADGILQKVFPHLGVNINRINAEQEMAGTFNVCNYSFKTNEAVPHTRVTLPHLIAGVSLPLFMPAVKIANDWYIDAVWIKDANLMEAIKRGAEEIWLIWAIGNQHEYKSGSFNQYVHMIEMSANGALFAEFDYLNELNARIQKGDSPYGQRQPIRVHVIKPEYPLPLDTDLYLNKINTTTLIDLGYADAQDYLHHLSPEVNVPSPLTTKMKSPSLAFSLRMKLTGTLFDQPAHLYVSLALPDIYAFMQHQEPYQLAGHITLGVSTRAYCGYQSRIQAETNTPNPEKAILLFSIKFKIENKIYLLQGQINRVGAGHLRSGWQVPIQLFAGENTSGDLVTDTKFHLSTSDLNYFRKSLNFYHTRNWFAKRRARRDLRQYFFNPN